MSQPDCAIVVYALWLKAICGLPAEDTHATRLEATKEAQASRDSFKRNIGLDRNGLAILVALNSLCRLTGNNATHSSSAIGDSNCRGRAKAVHHNMEKWGDESHEKKDGEIGNKPDSHLKEWDWIRMEAPGFFFFIEKKINEEERKLRA